MFPHSEDNVFISEPKVWKILIDISAYLKAKPRYVPLFQWHQTQSVSLSLSVFFFKYNKQQYSTTTKSFGSHKYEDSCLK